MTVLSGTTCTYKEKELPCQMTTEEYAAKSKEMVDWMTAISQMEDKIEAVKNAYKQPIKDAEEKVDDIRLVLNSGSISRKVSVAKIYDWDRCCCYERRCDNGEIVPGSWHMMTESELQRDATQTECPENWKLNSNEFLLHSGQTDMPTKALPAPISNESVEDVEFVDVTDTDSLEDVDGAEDDDLSDYPAEEGKEESAHA